MNTASRRVRIALLCFTLTALVAVTMTSAVTPTVSAASTVKCSEKRYIQNEFRVNVAWHRGCANWNYSNGDIPTNGVRQLWQEKWTAPGFGYKDESNWWTRNSISVGNTHHVLTFTSGIETRFGNLGFQLTNRIQTLIDGAGRMCC